MLTEKYAPKNLKEVIGQDVSKILEYLKNPKGALLIYGPSGVGKTSAVKALRGEGYDVLEINSSSTRDASTMKEIVGSAVVNKSLFGPRVVLVDDVDSIPDRGGIPELIKCIKKAKNPIILTAIDPWTKKLRTLRTYCTLLEFKPLRSTTIKAFLKKVAQKEGIDIDEKALLRIAVNSQGDLRAALNTLEIFSNDSLVTLREVELLSQRSKPSEIFNALRVLFNSSSILEAFSTLDSLNMDLDTKMLWIHENIPREFYKNIDKAFYLLSRADIFNSRVISTQYYRFIYYSLLFLSSIGLYKQSRGFVKYSSPILLKLLSKLKIKREKIKEKAINLDMHCSFKKKMENLFYLLPIVELT